MCGRKLSLVSLTVAGMAIGPVCAKSRGLIAQKRPKSAVTRTPVKRGGLHQLDLFEGMA